MNKYNAFTMAEILLSLTIIGVVAAITLPSLTGNINERTWNTQRKALYARVSQAISLMPALNGYGTLKEETSSGAGDGVDTAAETFVTQGLAKVLKINNICDNEHLSDCGLPTKMIAYSNANNTSNSNIELSDIKTLKGYNSLFISMYYIKANTKAAAFETTNGESILVYYNPNCRNNDSNIKYVQPFMCANFVYDLNGKKGPNTIGKDIGFITALYPSDSVVVAPQILAFRGGSVLHKDAHKACQTYYDNSRLANSEEAAAIFYNKRMINYDLGTSWTATFTTDGTNKAWVQNFHQGARGAYSRATTRSGILCIKR